MSKIRIELQDAGVKAKLQAMTDAAENMRPAYATIGRALINRIRMCFRLGIDPWGNPWVALKMRKGQALRDTGRLNRSILSRVDASGVTVGTNVQYAPVHQFGATIVPKTKPSLVFPGPNGRPIFAKKVVIPARSFMPLRRGAESVQLPPDWEVSVTAALRSYFQTKAEKGSE